MVDLAKLAAKSLPHLHKQWFDFEKAQLPLILGNFADDEDDIKNVLLAQKLNQKILDFKMDKLKSINAVII